MPVSAPHERELDEVLFLSSFDPDLPDIDALIEETESQILEGRSTPVHFSVEYIAPHLAEGEPSYAKLSSLLRAKYGGRSFDLVVTIGNDTLEFARNTRARLFPDATILFFLTSTEDAALPQQPNMTGVIRRLNYLPTLQVALLQNPGARHVIVVCGSSRFEKGEMQAAEEQFRPIESELDIQYWTDLEFRDLNKRLAKVPDNSVVLFLDFLENPAGEHFTPNRVLRTVSADAHGPIYGTVLSYVGSGVVGGSVADLRQVGSILGHAGARLLNGESIENISSTTGDFQRYVFDWRQLHRWKISEKQIPPGSSILFWEHSTWELYRWRILGLVALAVAQAVLIALLLASDAKRKRALAELRQSQERFAQIFQYAPLGISLTTVQDHRYIDVNKTFEALTGYSREELIGRNALEVGISHNLAERAKFAEQLRQDGRLQGIEFLYRRKDGEVRAAMASVEMIEVDGIPCALGMSGDITERKRAEQALRESELRFRLMADSAPILMWLSDPYRLCTDFNQEWLRFTGRSIEQEMGSGWTQGVHADDLAQSMEAYATAFDLKRPFQIEFRLRRSDGQYRWMLDRGVPRFLSDGSFAGYIGCCIDITDEKAAKVLQAELSGRLLQAQEEERARIARELHDDISQRLALLANELQELQHKSTRCAETWDQVAIGRLWELTSEIASDVQYLSHQLHPSKLQYLGLGAAVRDLGQEFARQHKIALECIVHDLPRDLDQTVTLSLFRTVQESLRNVAKHSHARHVKVELKREQGTVRLRVSDDGIGFDLGLAPNSGLGLISMRERLRLVGGEFSVSSQPNCGTRIEASVPVPAKTALIA